MTGRLDVVDLRTFYNQPLGLVARRLVGLEIARLSGPATGLSIVGLGFATPFLRPLRENADRVLALMPAAQGVLHWPPEGRFASALVHDADLPLADGAVDRVVAVHMLEAAESIDDTLREIWRVLAPGGRLIAVVPNRRGLWARFDTTPFGHGRPFSKTQLSAMLQAAMLTPEDWSEALFLPPFSRRGIARFAGFFERSGRAIGVPMSGVLVVSATKQVFQRVAPQRSRRFQVRIAPVLKPRPAARISSEPGM